MTTPITAIFLNWFNPKKPFLWFFLFFVLICGASVYMYTNNYSKIINKVSTTDIPNAPAESQQEVTIMFFTVNWCPYCIKAQAPWDDFYETHHGKKKNGRTIICKQYDITAENTTEKAEAENISGKYNVTGYPTIIMLKDGKKIEFDAKVSTHSLNKFVEDMA